MRQKSAPEKQPAEETIKDIRRATRRHFSAEEKIRVVPEGLRGEESIAEPCRREASPGQCTTAGRRSSWGRQETACRRHGARCDLRRGEGAPPRGAGAGGGRPHPRKPTAQKRMARPVCKGFDRERRTISLLQRIRPRRFPPGQDGDTRAPVLIKHSASSVAFFD
jgi:hypothetical protein